MTPKISKPHNYFFREIWSDRSFALDFLENYLPENVLSLADLSTLEIQKDTFVEKGLQDYYSDLLYRVHLSGVPAFLYLLFEHKTDPHRWIHLRLQQCMRNIWEFLLEQEKESRRLPIVVPMVIYHGKEEWDQKRRFQDVFSGPVQETSPYIPDFEYILFDLSRLSDEEIRGEMRLQAVLLLIKHIFNPEIYDQESRLLALFQELFETERGRLALEILMGYLFGQVPDLAKEQIENMIRSVFSALNRRSS